MSDDEILEMVRGITNKIRVTKVVATRAVKGKRGDSYVGWSASWDTVQDDGGHGLQDTNEPSEEALSGMSFKEAQIAGYVVAMRVDLSAHEHAMAGGNLSPQALTEARAVIKSNYTKLIREALRDVPSPGARSEDSAGDQSEG